MNKKMLTSGILLALAAGSTSAVAADLSSMDFWGSGRMGAGASNGDVVNPEASGNKSGNNIIKAAGSRYESPGRLGNEGYGLEFGIRQNFEEENNKFDVVLFVDDGYNGKSDNLKMAQVYAGGKGFIPGQEEMYIWGGKRFQGRIYVGINDSFILVNDGNGGGIDNIDVGIGKFDIGFTAGDNGNNNRYVITNQLHDVQIAEGQTLRLDANWGFYAGPEIAVDQNDNMQFALSHKLNWSKGENNFTIRYGENVRRNAIGWSDYTAEADLENIGVFDYGNVRLTDDFTIDYMVSYENSEFSDYRGTETWIQGIVRPQYSWTNYMSTWVELGYDQVEFEDQNATNSAYKVTVSQNFQLGKYTWCRPQVRFYATYGELDTEANKDNTGGAVNSTSELGDSDALTFGIMFDAYW